MDIIKDGYTRISDIISKYSGYGNVPEHILQAACERGTKVHEIIEAIFEGLGAQIDEKLHGYIKSFDSWYTNVHQHGFLQPERWYDDDNLITGKCDCLMDVDGVLSLIDFKTSAKIGTSWILQGGGYCYLAQKCGIYVDKIRFIKLLKNGDAAEIIDYDVPQSVSLFEKALDLHKLMTQKS